MCVVRRVAVAAIALQFLGVASRALAEPTAADVVTAKAAMRDGREARAKGDWKGAVANFRAAYALVPTPNTGNELAQALQKAGRLVEAREIAFAVVKIPVRDGEPANHAEGRRACAEIAAELDARIPKVTVAIAGLAKGVDANVSLDDDPLPTATLGAARAVDPGHHVLMVRADGYPDQRHEFDVGER